MPEIDISQYTPYPSNTDYGGFPTPISGGGNNGVGINLTGGNQGGSNSALDWAGLLLGGAGNIFGAINQPDQVTNVYYQGQPRTVTPTVPRNEPVDMPSQKKGLPFWVWAVIAVVVIVLLIIIF